MKTIKETEVAGRKGLTCENCGLPSDATTCTGYAFALETMPDSKFQHRSTKHRVWCCGEECVVQALAQNKYGVASHKWPVTLAEFRQLEGEPFLRRLKRSNRTESTLQVVETVESKTGLFEKVTLPHTEGISVRLRGRPRKWESEKDRLRSYRDKQRTEGLTEGAGARGV